ncbi:MAG: hypothetical protein QM756_16385 [Polyangiaceae bacterium]
MSNTNCLRGVRCPECGNAETFYIEIPLVATVTDEGVQDVSGEHYWDEGSFARCAECDEGGLMSRFMQPDG